MEQSDRTAQRLHGHSRSAGPIGRVLCALLLALVLSNTTAASESPAPAAATRQYTFAWPYVEQGALAPRGGTTLGPELTLEPAPSAAWQQLQAASELPAYEKDRLAILAMAGTFRSTFDFLETVGFTNDYQPAQPYQSWGTEKIYVIADEPGFIALQHLLVMQIRQPDGSLTEPYVVKHWRQDWRYQDRDMHQFAGHRTWQQRKLARRDAAGQWTQAVYQVDDSPRYEAIGRWQHTGGVASWLSSETWRPLPRREFSVRKDYEVLIGTNRHTITPTGWVQEEENQKVVLTADGAVRRVIAKEVGFNRYERITDYDWTAGDEYWERTAPFWNEVRQFWDAVFAKQPRFTVQERLDGQSLLFTLFEQAEATAGQPAAALREAVEQTITPFLEPAP